MKVLPNHGAPGTASSQPPRRRAIGACVLAVLLVVSITSVVGCGGSAHESQTSGGGPASSGVPEAMAGATSTIALDWDQRNNCVAFVPKATMIHPGDRVNFTTSMSDPVTVHVPPGLFSDADTTITVTRDADHISPAVRSIGAYPLTSHPPACVSLEVGGGPAIIVNQGQVTGQP